MNAILLPGAGAAPGAVRSADQDHISWSCQSRDSRIKQTMNKVAVATATPTVAAIKDMCCISKGWIWLASREPLAASWECGYCWRAVTKQENALSSKAKRVALS